jgi:hypothetical protein
MTAFVDALAVATVTADGLRVLPSYEREALTECQFLLLRYKVVALH